jgi:hypothetical protein
MDWLRRKAVFLSWYAILFLLFFGAPFAVTLGLMWLFGGFNDPWWPIAVLVFAVIGLYQFPDRIHDFIIGVMEKRGVRDLRKL